MDLDRTLPDIAPSQKDHDVLDLGKKRASMPIMGSMARAIKDVKHQVGRRRTDGLVRRTLRLLLEDRGELMAAAVFHAWAMVVQRSMARAGRQWCKGRIGVVTSYDDEDVDRSEAMQRITALWKECGSPEECRSFRPPSAKQQPRSFDLLEWLLSPAEEEGQDEEQGDARGISMDSVSKAPNSVSERGFSRKGSKGTSDRSGSSRRGSKDSVPMKAGSNSPRVLPPPITQTKRPTTGGNLPLPNVVTIVRSPDAFNADGSPSARGGSGHYEDQRQTTSTSVSASVSLDATGDPPFKEESISCLKRKSLDSTLHPDSIQPTKPDFHRRHSDMSAERGIRSAGTGKEATRRSQSKDSTASHASSSSSYQDRLSKQREHENYIQKMNGLARKALESRVHQNEALKALHETLFIPAGVPGNGPPNNEIQHNGSDPSSCRIRSAGRMSMPIDVGAAYPKLAYSIGA